MQGAVSGPLGSPLQHSLSGHTRGWDSALQKLKQQKLWEYGWAEALEHWLPSGMVLLAIWQMVQAGRYWCSNRHTFQKNTLRFFKCVRVHNQWLWVCLYQILKDLVI